MPRTLRGFYTCSLTDGARNPALMTQNNEPPKHMTQSTEAAVTMFEGMRRLVSGVCVVTAVDEQGERYAMTATSVTSVSGEPPSLLVCVNQQARLHAAVSHTDFFCINVLAPQHEQVSINCASPEMASSRFTEGAWMNHSDSGVPYLSDAQSVFFCRKSQSMVYGTHTIFVGEVEQTLVAPGEPRALAYINGAYRHL